MEMEDGSTPPHKFINLCSKVMSLKVTEKDGTPHYALTPLSQYGPVFTVVVQQ
jgi:hypothetical protein